MEAKKIFPHKSYDKITKGFIDTNCREILLWYLASLLPEEFKPSRLYPEKSLEDVLERNFFSVDRAREEIGREFEIVKDFLRTYSSENESEKKVWVLLRQVKYNSNLARLILQKNDLNIGYALLYVKSPYSWGRDISDAQKLMNENRKIHNDHIGNYLVVAQERLVKEFQEKLKAQYSAFNYGGRERRVLEMDSVRYDINKGMAEAKRQHHDHQVQREREFEDLNPLRPLSVDNYYKTRLGIQIREFEALGTKYRRIHAGFGFLNWLLNSSAAILVILGFQSWSPILLIFATFITSYAEARNIASRLLSINDCIISLRDLEKWWQGLNIIEKRHYKWKAKLVQGVESTILSELSLYTDSLAPKTSDDELQLQNRSASESEQRREKNLS